MASKTSLRRSSGISIAWILIVLCLVLSGGCSSAITVTTTPPTFTTSPAPTSPMAYVNNPLPTWTAGKFNAALLEVRGGVSPYTWTLKEGSRLPEGFMLYTDGKFTGTPPLLSGNTSMFITPPFTIVITDSAGQQLEVELNVAIVQPETNTSGNGT